MEKFVFEIFVVLLKRKEKKWMWHTLCCYLTFYDGKLSSNIWKFERLWNSGKPIYFGTKVSDKVAIS